MTDIAADRGRGISASETRVESVTYLDAIRSALADALDEDPRVFLLGEDIGRMGGAFGATAGLSEVFGAERVIDAPICEEGFVGAAFGAAWMGARPIVEIQFADFITCAFDPLVTVGAKTHWRSGLALPVVVRAPTGGGIRGGPFHAGSPEGHFVGIPGLKVVCPATVRDAYGLLRAAIDDPNPVLYFEHKALYRRLRDEAPATGMREALGQARIVRSGSDATIVTYSASVGVALEAVAEMSGDIEIIDLRTIWPVDERTILESIGRTSRVLILQEAARSSGAAGLLMSLIAEQGFELLDAPPALHAPPDTPVPFAPELEDGYLPSVASTVAALENLLAY